jgi:hypothetical protein
MNEERLGKNRFEREVRMIDISSPEGAEVQVSASVGNPKEATLWVNVDGICRLRITGLTKDNLVVDIAKGIL